MTDEAINIEIDGRPLQARKGAMIIEVADEAGIYIPRFCYHHKLSIAANCRMCLVEVEKAPKPMPACATPVMDGMKVHTGSPKAIDAQRGTMEFLLINHPLDCPICDQGGECELQDLAMGYGSDVSRFTEGKRVVPDKNIGPLISTDMTRCIHCTRCVRFGQEIAGMMELGAPGRGENMRIMTYMEEAVGSEMSGNVIDLCPVGALNAKPSRMAARAWELTQHASVAPHDCIGSNVYVHTLRGQVIRVVPRDNEAINECWISDRDRFGYEGVKNDARLATPMVRGPDGEWQEADWEAALDAAAKGIRAAGSEYGPDQLGVLVSPNATVEEMYLLNRLARGLGSGNIDHRLRQADFSDQDQAPVFPWLGRGVADLERADAALLVGSNIRKEQPIAAHRLRKAALGGASLMFVNPRDFDFHFPVAEKITCRPDAMVEALAAIARAMLEAAGTQAPESLRPLISGMAVGDTHRVMAERLTGARRPAVLLGSQAHAHPQLALLRALCGVIAEACSVVPGYLTDGCNAAGAWLAGAVPHRGAGGQSAENPGLDARAMLDSPRRAYLLHAVEPEHDCWNPAAARAAMEQAGFVVMLTSHLSEAMKDYAHVLLPAAAFAETSGTYVNAEGTWQRFAGAVPPKGEARPAWKVLRVLGNLLALDGFDYLSSEDVLAELERQVGELKADNRVAPPPRIEVGERAAGLQRASGVAIYHTDALVRHARALQQTADGADTAARVNSAVARRLRLEESERVLVRQGDARVSMALTIDDGIADECVWIPAGTRESARLGPMLGALELEPD